MRVQTEITAGDLGELRAFTVKGDQLAVAILAGTKESRLPTICMPCQGPRYHLAFAVQSLKTVHISPPRFATYAVFYDGSCVGHREPHQAHADESVVGHSRWEGHLRCSTARGATASCALSRGRAGLPSRALVKKYLCTYVCGTAFVSTDIRTYICVGAQIVEKHMKQNIELKVGCIVGLAFVSQVNTITDICQLHIVGAHKLNASHLRAYVHTYMHRYVCDHMQWWTCAQHCIRTPLQEMRQQCGCGPTCLSRGDAVKSWPPGRTLWVCWSGHMHSCLRELMHVPSLGTAC